MGKGEEERRRKRGKRKEAKEKKDKDLPVGCLFVTNKYRRDNSILLMFMSLQEWQMDTELVEKAELKLKRGPTSSRV